MRVLTRKTRLTLTLTAISVATAALAGPATAQPERPRISASGPAHSLADARTHAAVKQNAWQHDTLARHSQQNWYRVTLTTRSYLYSLLGSLPADYNLRLYDDAGKVLNTSDHTKTNAETIGRRLASGTYFVRVASTHGASARTKYSLLLRTVPVTATIGVLTAHVGNANTVTGDLVNLSDQWQAVPRMDVKLYDRDGKLLRRKREADNLISWIPTAPGARVPFSLLVDVPYSILNKTVRVVAVPKWDTMTTRTPVALTVSDVTRVYHHRNGLTWVDFTAKVHNPSSRRLPLATAVVEARDNRGVLVGADSLSGPSLPAHSTRTYRGTYYNLDPHLHLRVKAFEYTDNTGS
jgi:hypothetical protein